MFAGRHNCVVADTSHYATGLSYHKSSISRLSTIGCITSLATDSSPTLKSLRRAHRLTQSLPNLHNLRFNFNLLSIRYGLQIYTIQRPGHSKRLPETLLRDQGQGNRCDPVKECRRGAPMQVT